VKKVALVDGENVGSFDRFDAAPYDEIHLFRGATQRRLKPPAGLNVVIHDVQKTGRNNLDFHLTLHLGVLHQAVDKSAQFYVISGDKGFDGVCQHLQSLGRQCTRLDPLRIVSPERKVIRALFCVSERQRPRTLARLKNHVATILHNTDTRTVESCVEALRSDHITVLKSGRIEYCY